MEFEQVLENNLGTFGLWQKLLLFGSSLTYLPAILYLPTFPDFEMNFRCKVPQCEADPPRYGDLAYIVPPGKDVLRRCSQFQYIGGADKNGTCTRKDFNFSSVVGCHDWVYDHNVFESSIMSTFNSPPCSSVNDPDWIFGTYITKVEMPEMVFWLGMMIGNTLFGWVADNYGPNATIIGVSGALSLFAVFIGFTTSLVSYACLSFLIGFCALTASTVSQAVLSEAVPAKNRRVIVLTKVLRVVGSMTSGLVAYASQSWRIIWWYGAVLNATICPMWIFLNESPRWLLSKGKYAKAERSMEFAAKLNKTELPPKVAAELVAAAKERNTAVAARKKAGKGGSTMRFYRSCIIWKNLLTVFFGWFATMMVHFGLIRRSVNLGMGGNIYTNFILMDSTELVAIIISMFTINRLGRRSLLATCAGVGGVLIIFAQMADFKHETGLELTLLLIGKTMASMSNQVYTVFVAELFPTDIRNSAMGSGNTFGRLGALAGSVMVESPAVEEWALFILGGFYLAAAVATLVLVPETNNKPMPETMGDVKRMDRESLWHKCCGCLLRSSSDKDDDDDDGGTDAEEQALLMKPRQQHQE